MRGFAGSWEVGRGGGRRAVEVLGFWGLLKGCGRMVCPGWWDGGLLGV